jgi:deoxyribodipyrimidine photo-lyase
MLHIYWFRKDLRVTDNYGLSEFVKRVSADDSFLFLYVKNKNTFNYFGEKRISFLYESLADLKEELQKHRLILQIIEGKSSVVFREIIDKYKQVSVYCNEQVEPYCIGRDNEVRDILKINEGSFFSFTDTTIFPLGEIKNGEGAQYRVYTPFKNQCLKVLTSDHYRETETDLGLLSADKEVMLNGFNDFSFESVNYERSEFIRGGRKEGIVLLKKFYESGLDEYKSKSCLLYTSPSPRDRG